MKSLVSTPAQFIRLATALLFGAALMSGCSSSSNPTTVEPDATNGTTDGVTADDAVGETTSVTTTGNTTDTTTVVPDPMVQNTTQVNFEITVPAYQSDSLQVRLVWGDNDFNAMWVGDESWSASSEFTSNTEQPLLVTFYDLNGELELGIYEANFKTSTNAAESYQITADQFDVNRFDLDNDGVSNFKEGIAGTDPLVDESLPFEVRESITQGAIKFFNGLEDEIPTDRPYFIDTRMEDGPDSDYPRRNSNRTIDIDADGTGTLSIGEGLFTAVGHFESDRNTATRTNTGNSIVWMGSDAVVDSAELASDVDEYTIEINLADKSAPTMVGSSNQNAEGTLPVRSTTSYSFIGQPIEGSSDCEATSGSYRNVYNPVGTSYGSTTTIIKDVADRYWKVVIDRVSQDENIEYFLASIGAFRCDFVDIQ